MFLRMLFRNAWRHKLRTLLTLVGMSIAILAFGLLQTVVDAWYAGVDASSNTRLVTRNSISLIFPLPLSYRDKIRSIDGVTTVTYGNWFGGYYKDEKNFFANFAVEPESYLTVYPEFVLPPDQKEAFFRNRKGAVAGRNLAERFGWEVGDTITLTGTIFPGQWEFELEAIYQGWDETIDESQFLFHWEYLNESIRKMQPLRADEVGFYIEDIQRSDMAARVAESIDSLFENSLAETRTETEKSFQMGFISMTEAIITTIHLVSLVVILIILAVVANTMAMSVRERLREYAVLKTLGFSGMQIGSLIFGESLLISLLGGGIGVALTYPAALLFSMAVGRFFPIFNIQIETIGLDFAAIFLVGIVSAVFPAISAVRVRIAEGLMRVG
ncbi:MAG: ABC transporter permease [Desulfovibrionales bacterium]